MPDYREEAADDFRRLYRHQQEDAHEFIKALRALGGTAEGVAIMRRARLPWSRFELVKHNARIGMAMSGGCLVWILGTTQYTMRPTKEQMSEWVAWMEQYIRTRQRTLDDQSQADIE